MGGSSKTIDTTPEMTKQFRQQMQEYIFNPQGSAGTAKVPGAPERVNILGAQPVSTTFNSGTDINRGQVRDVDSVDKLGGGSSEFFKNMMGQLAPSFAQARSEAVAAGKEAGGSLTGSGFGNRVGTALNRSLGNEQATLANYATQGIGMEMQRQQANQAADTNFMQALLTRNAQGLQAQGMSSAAEQFNSGQAFQRNMSQSQLDAARQAMMYQGQLGVNQQNASNFMQALMQQSSLGVGPSTVQQSGGWGQVAGSLGGMALGSFLGPVGAAAGAKVGGALFGGK